MADIIITSRAYGTHIVTIDDEDFDRVSQYTWGIQKTKSGIFYAKTSIVIDGKWKRRYLHRFILNVWDRWVFVDHKDLNGLNCYKSNLRTCTLSENLRNRRSYKNVSSKFLGVCWHKKRQKWEATICFNKKVIGLGIFALEVDAAKAYDKKAKELFGQFANPNFK